MKTDAVIKQEGISALISKLGYVDAERFIVLINREPFDYTNGIRNLQMRDSRLRFDELKRAATDKDFQMQLMIELLPEDM